MSTEEQSHLVKRSRSGALSSRKQKKEQAVKDAAKKAERAAFQQKVANQPIRYNRITKTAFDKWHTKAVESRKQKVAEQNKQRSQANK
jgi:hypothetical protein